MRILITGAAGFIGANLARFLGPEHELVGLDDLSTGNVTNLEAVPIDLMIGSILDPSALATAVAGCDAIVHLAARPSVPRSISDPVASHEANATGTLRVLEAARSAASASGEPPMVIIASSSSVYGSNPVIPKREDLMPMPMSPYAVSKLAAEQYALAWQTSFGLSTLAFRFFNVYGPLQAPGHAYAAVIPAFLHAAITGTDAVVHGDGTQSRDFTFVETVCEVISTALEQRITSPNPVNLAFGSRTSLLELLQEIESVTGTSVSRKHTDSRLGDVYASQADNAQLTRLFPNVTPTPLRTGLDATATWMRAQIEDV